MFHITVAATSKGWMSACGELRTQLGVRKLEDKDCQDCKLVLDLTRELEATVVVEDQA